MEEVADKEHRIAAIVEHDKKAFEEWVKDPVHTQRLDLPKDAARYLLIPSRILNLTSNPEQTDVVIVEQSEHVIDGLVVERRPAPVSNPESLKAYLDARREYEEKVIKESEQQGQSRVRIIVPSMTLQPPPVPEDVDKFHGENFRLVRDGIVGLNDYVANRIILRNETDSEVLYVGDYKDRDELHGKGVATSFYDRLEGVASEMGFRFIMGWNLTGQEEFFRQKRERSTLGEVKPEFRAKFSDNLSDVNLRTTTIHFVNPQDKALFLSSPS